MADNKKMKRLTKEMRGKIKVTYAVMICLFLLLAGQIIYWNIRYGQDFSTQVLGQQTNKGTEIPYERGKIYDCNGNLLAGNEKLYTLVLEPKNIFIGDQEKQDIYLNTTVRKVCEYFKLNEEEIREKIKAKPDTYYVPVRVGEITYPEVQAFEKFMENASKKITDSTPEDEKAIINDARNTKGVAFHTVYKRIYPYNSLACHLIGFTVSGDVGNWGIEQYYNSTLNGTAGRTYSYFDEELIKEQTIKESINGNNVISTINLQVQQIIEKKLKEFDETIGSAKTSILVMNPNNGEVLGMANSDPFNLNHPADKETLLIRYTEKEIDAIKKFTDEIKDYSEKKKAKIKKKKKKQDLNDAYSTIWRNAIISDTHEPGSTYKPFTVCAGLESGVLTGKEEYVCTGSLEVAKSPIGCSHVHGQIDLKASIAESCNVAMMNIAFNEGKDNFYYYQKLFGFGGKTGIDLPGEENTSGLVYTAEKCKDSASLATNAFGQNFNCTMIEMATAFASLINGGYYYEPHVVKEIQNYNGDIVETKEKKLLRRTISRETSNTIRKYMKETVDKGTGTKAQIPGYTVGGKTGTAEKMPRNKEDYYISFMGFTPVEAPQLLIYVTIDEPNIDDQASAGLAVGLEQECMREIVEVLGIQPSKKVSKKEANKKQESYMAPYLRIREEKKKEAAKKAAEEQKAAEEKMAAEKKAAEEKSADDKKSSQDKKSSKDKEEDSKKKENSEKDSKQEEKSEDSQE